MKSVQKTLLFPLLLVLYEIATYLSNDMYLPALPQMMSELGLTIQQAQLTLTSWFIGQASMPLIMGVISDRFGRRPVLLWGGVAYTLATIACALTQDSHSLLIARFIEGSMITSMVVPGYACIHELYEKNEAIRMLALMGSISVLAPAFGPLLGSFVLLIADWRTIFWFIAIYSALSILLLYKWMPETLAPEERQPLHLRTLITNYWGVLTNQRFMLLMLVLGFIFAGFIAWITAGPLLIIDSFHFSPLAFGIIQAIIFAMFIFGNRCVKYLLERLSVNKLILTGLVLTMSGGVLMFDFAYLMPTSIRLFIPTMMLYSFGSALCFAPLNRSIIEASDKPMGVRMAMFMVFLSGFAAFGSAMSSIYFDGSIPALAYIIAAAITLSCLVKCFVSTRE